MIKDRGPPTQVGNCTIYLGDCREVLRTFPSKSVNCCVTSPPYFGLRDYGNDEQIGMEQTPQAFVNQLVEVFREVRRVLLDDGTFWLNLGDSYAANRTYQVPSTKGGPKHGPGQSAGGKGSVVPDGLKPKDLIGIPWRVALALQADGWYLRQDIIWHKPNPMPESVRDRCTKAHEYIFLLSKREQYYFDGEAIKEPLAESSVKRGKVKLGGIKGDNYEPKPGDPNFRNGAHQWGREMDFSAGGTRNKRSVWTVTSKPFKGAHFATFPPDLIEPCILAGCPEGGTVLDPFFGAGTTGLVSAKHGRRCVGIELNSDYRDLAATRLRGEKIESSTTSEQLFTEPGEPTLFDMLA